MTKSKTTQHIIAAAVGAAGLVFATVPQALAAETVTVTTNNSADSMRMGLFLNPETVKAGHVTFHLDNQSKTLPHEAIVIRLSDQQVMNPMDLPYNDDTMRVPEDAVDAMGEVPETEPGRSGDVTLDLSPGVYEVMCNIEGHYGAGMHALLTVK